MIHKAPYFKHKNYIGYLVMPYLESQKHRQAKQKDTVNAAICTLT